MNIVILDEDKIAASNLSYSMQQDDYNVTIARSPDSEVENIKKGKYDFVITDLNFKSMNGLTLIQNIRKACDVPIIVTTNIDDDIQKILALEYGADDYLIKPYNILELKVRMKAILRRKKVQVNEKSEIEIKFDDYTIKPIGRVLSKGDTNISLTGKEFDLLYVMSLNPGRVYSREELMTKIWGYDYYGDARSIDVHIRRIREKIETDSKNPKYVLTKWGLGYYFYDYRNNDANR